MNVTLWIVLQVSNLGEAIQLVIEWLGVSAESHLNVKSQQFLWAIPNLNFMGTLMFVLIFLFSFIIIF